MEVDVAQDAYGLQRADIARVLPVALSYVASSLVEPRPRIINSGCVLECRETPTSQVTI